MTRENLQFDPHWLACAAEGQWHGMPERPIQRMCHDTRDLRAGDLYVALRGSRVDGHSLLEEAFRAGAVAALVDQAYMASRSAPSPSPGPLLVVQEALPALAHMASMHRHRAGAWITGITGSMGKTTVKDMTSLLLRQIGPTVSTRGNWNNAIGLPLSVLALQMDTTFGVFELGMNHPGEIAPLSEMLSPDWGVVTAIGPVHLEHFASVDAIAQEKAGLLRSLPRSGLAFLHAGDPYFRVLREAAQCPVRTLQIGADGDADLIAEYRQGRIFVREPSTDASVDVPVPIPGRHNLVNAGLAMLVARAAGVSWDLIREGFSLYQPSAMRWEMQMYEGCTVVNDAYNANPASMRAALETFAEMRVQGAKWLVLGDMLELGVHAEAAHQELGRLVAAGNWVGLVVVGLHAQTVRAAALEAGFSAAAGCFHTVQEAGDWLLPRLTPGDAILLKGSRGVQLENLLVRFRK